MLFRNLFQSTRPIRGATSMTTISNGQLCHFNPRAPYGARRQHKNPAGDTPDISIHAPHTGRDRRRSRAIFANTNFNPRAPYGARHFPFDQLEVE